MRWIGPRRMPTSSSRDGAGVARALGVARDRPCHGRAWDALCAAPDPRAGVLRRTWGPGLDPAGRRSCGPHTRLTAGVPHRSLGDPAVRSGPSIRDDVGVPTFPRLPLNIERGALNTLGRAPQPVHRVIGVRSAPSDGASLHPEAALTLRLLSIAPSSGFESMPLAKGRALIDHDAAVLGGPPLPMARVEGVRIPTPSGGIGGRLYVADERNTDRILVYFHGGGFVVGSLDSVDTVCRFIARHAGVAVLSVDYRLAPEHQFPAAHEDALAAFRFAVDQAAAWGHDPRFIAVGGDSAGATMATVLCHDLRGSGEVNPSFQLLFYPATDQVGSYPSHEEFAEGFFLTRAQMTWFRGLVLAGHDPADPRVSPLLAEDLTGLPQAYIAVAGFDVVRDEGEAYARRLAQSGVPVALRRHEGLIHSFVNATGVSAACRDALLEACGALRAGVGGGLALRTGSLATTSGT